ncbi:MAG: hypothetical protein K0B08_02465 [Bacteroidales bacterium]|nr:hypothetical protein [Bacteroidales bacterium]
MSGLINWMWLFVVVMLFSGCGKDNNGPDGKWAKSVFIVNEGPFQSGSGTISAFNRDSVKVSHGLFEGANGRPLGNIVQSMQVVGDLVFIVVNGGDKIEVAKLEDFKSVATVSNLSSPRYFFGFNEEKGYVSCWDNTVKVINMHDFTVMEAIPTGAGPDEMIVAGDYLFVINSGGFGDDSTVTYIKTSDESVHGNIEVWHRPSGIVKDLNGYVWVLCSGKGYYGYPSAEDTPARLVCIDPANLSIIREVPFNDPGNHPDVLVINSAGTILYYNYPDGIYSFPVSATALNASPLVPAAKMYYSLGYDPSLDMLCASDPLDYNQNGWIYRFRADNGAPVDSFMAGIVPNGFWFN